MKYEYIIYDVNDTETALGIFSSDVQITGIIPGQFLLLESSQHSSRPGFHLKVSSIETYIFAPEEVLKKLRFRVYCEQVEIQ